MRDHFLKPLFCSLKNTLMEINFSTRFPVKFFDGKTESDEGTISINPSLTFKSFQSLISQQLKISPHQITIYFERNDQNPNFHQNHHHRRHPVTRKFNFSSIMGDSDSSFFWVVKKRSRRSRRRNSRVINDFPSPGDVLPNFVLLRRNFEEFDYMKMLEEREREEYLMSLSLNSNVYYDLNHFYGYGGLRLSDDGASSSGNGSSIDVHRQCDICFHNAIYGGETTPFHFCTNDIVVSDFRSTAGPIAPPSKTA